MQRFAESPRGVVAIDGKTLRHSFDRAAGSSALHLISAWAADQRLVLGQRAVDGKSNEITAIPKLLEMLSLKGTIITIDAIGCQREVAQIRNAMVSSDITWLQEQHGWPGLAAIGKIQRSREIGDKTTSETAYYPLSTKLSAKRFNEVARHRWGNENSHHWVLDCTKNGDQARNRKNHGPENLAMLRRMAINLARLEPSKGSMKGKLKRAGWDNQFLAQLLAQFAKSQMR